MTGLCTSAASGLRWAVGRHRIRAYVYQNHPVITADPGHADDQHALEAVGIVARRLLRSSPHRDTLRTLYDEWAPRAPTASSPPMRDCRCPRHSEDVAGNVVPMAASADMELGAANTVTVADLLEWEAIDAEPDEDDPNRWSLWFGDETRAHYDDDAPRSLEQAVASLAGMTDVDREDRETVLVTAADRCRDGMLAVAAEALLDNRVRRR